MSAVSSNISSSSDLDCIFTRPNSALYTMANIVSTLVLLPLCVFILYHGLRLWCQASPSSSSSSLMSHSDAFIYHMLVMELVGVFGYSLSIYAIIWEDIKTFIRAFPFFYLTWYGEMLFHLLTCVERYLAVVHPVIYRNLRAEKGIRIRNVSIVCVWLFSIGEGVLSNFVSLIIPDFCFMIIAATVVSFCSLSVLRVLVRPGPGEQGRNRERVDQSKRRAFYTMVAILVTLFLRFSVELIWTMLAVPGKYSTCVLMGFEILLTRPSSLVLPLLFLHRHGKMRLF